MFIVIFFFFFNDTATTEIYTLSLHDALPISATPWRSCCPRKPMTKALPRSEEHMSELQSLAYLVCRLLLEKKKKKIITELPFEKKKNYGLIKEKGTDD